MCSPSNLNLCCLTLPQGNTWFIQVIIQIQRPFSLLSIFSHILSFHVLQRHLWVKTASALKPGECRDNWWMNLNEIHKQLKNVPYFSPFNLQMGYKITMAYTCSISKLTSKAHIVNTSLYSYFLGHSLNRKPFPYNRSILIQGCQIILSNMEKTSKTSIYQELRIAQKLIKTKKACTFFCT